MFAVIFKLVAVDLSRKAREWCLLPYPDHPRGCPAYGKRADCPPSCPKFEAYFESPFYLIAVCFDLDKHEKRMLTLHPEWSRRQARCVLYWQNSVESVLVEECRSLIRRLPKGFEYTLKPEAMGVNVITTCRKAGIPIKTRPNKLVWKVALIGLRKELGRSETFNRPLNPNSLEDEP